MDFVRDHPKTPVQPHKPPSISPLTDTVKKPPVARPVPVGAPFAAAAPIFDAKSNHEEGSLYVPPSDLACLTDPKHSIHVAPPGHQPLGLPKFEDVNTCMWTASHAANCPSEDRSASLVNILLQPMPPGLDSETQLPSLPSDYHTLIRLNLWCVVDGHGGGCVASYVSEVLLPHIAASVSRALGCAILDRGVCIVNGQRRDANALDLDGLIKTDTTTSSRLVNPNSIHYRSPFERSDSEEEGQRRANLATPTTRDDVSAVMAPARSVAPTTKITNVTEGDEQASSCKTSVKTAASPATREELVGTHSPKEVASITRAITESFLAVDEGWINSIDPVATHQTSCQSNGRWNSGACALVVFTIQRLDWTSVNEPGKESEQRDPETSRLNTCQNLDAARRRMLDYATRTKSDGTMSTGSSTSSLTTEEAVHASGIESEITETEGEEDGRTTGGETRCRNRDTDRASLHSSRVNRESFIAPPSTCSCHSYRAHDAMIYTAHVGDCRAVMLGSAPPRTIKVGDYGKGETDDESSHHSSDETECLSSSDHDADTSEEEDAAEHRKQVEEAALKTGESAEFITLPPRRVTRSKNPRRHTMNDSDGPFIALPPFQWQTIEAGIPDQSSKRDTVKTGQDVDGSDSSTSSQDSIDLLPLLQLLPSTGPIDLTTDHSAYNPAEVTAVLRRCNNAPRAISAGMGGGIKRVAGSLAVTRALGDAYLKTPKLSFNPYKNHAPYITARPEVNCRPLVKNGDKVLILATDGVWERASGEDVLRWVRNFYEERIAEAERRRIKRLNGKNQSSNEETDQQSNSKLLATNTNQEGSERDLFEKSEQETVSSRKREMTSSPVGHTSTKRRKRNRPNRISYNVADVIVRRVLNKVRRARNISSLQALMSLPQGRARRSKVSSTTHLYLAAR